MITIYSCPGCGTKGQVEHEDHADVLSVVWLLDDHHRKESPRCGVPYRRFKIHFQEMVASATEA